MTAAAALTDAEHSALIKQGAILVARARECVRPRPQRNHSAIRNPQSAIPMGLDTLRSLVADAPALPEFAWPELLRVVSEVFRVNAAELKTRGRTADVALARQVAMTVAWESGLTCLAVARFFGRDHGTVVHARKHVRALAQRGPRRDRARIKAVLDRFGTPAQQPSKSSSSCGKIN